jgi:type I restriction enzyme S subunit
MKKGGKLEGWKVEKLGDVCDIFNGGTPDTKVPKYWGGNILWITPKDMGKLESIYVDDTARKITDAGLKNSSARILPANSVILSSRAPIGHLAINTKEMTTNQGCKGIVPKKELSTLFLYYFLENSVELLNSLGSGTTFKELSASKLAEVVIPIPPLPEQQRIVHVLDEAFASIAQAKSNAERNLVNARELFQSHLQSVFTQTGDDWKEMSLGDVCHFENGDRGKNYPNRHEYVESGIPWINTGHIQPDGTLSQSEMNYITKEKYETLSQGKIQPGDLVYCLRGATLGKTALVDPYTEGAVASSLVIIRPSKLLDSHFLYYFLTSPVGQGFIKLYSNGAAQPNLGAVSVTKYIISLPPLAEQRAIVGRLEALSAETGRLEEIYEAKVEGLEELKKSVLGKAFGGEI